MRASGVSNSPQQRFIKNANSEEKDTSKAVAFVCATLPCAVQEYECALLIKHRCLPACRIFIFLQECFFSHFNELSSLRLATLTGCW
ncbi:hypothetical protein D5086_003480 [Populus alba]|uniref:Uncharacterized protein n=1 Tax=Populus alba TaxID=43335 RepID=A0ACC4D5L5_POPAL